jgi:hypothetical protein
VLAAQILSSHPYRTVIDVPGPSLPCRCIEEHRLARYWAAPRQQHPSILMRPQGLEYPCARICNRYVLYERIRISHTRENKGDSMSSDFLVGRNFKSRLPRIHS